jgi:hypothetical protein
LTVLQATYPRCGWGGPWGGEIHRVTDEALLHISNGSQMAPNSGAIEVLGNSVVCDDNGAGDPESLEAMWRESLSPT